MSSGLRERTGSFQLGSTATLGMWGASGLPKSCGMRVHEGLAAMQGCSKLACTCCRQWEAAPQVASSWDGHQGKAPRLLPSGRQVQNTVPCS